MCSSRLIVDSSTSTISNHCSFGIVVVHVARNKIAFYRPLFPQLLNAIATVRAGQVVHSFMFPALLAASQAQRALTPRFHGETQRGAVDRYSSPGAPGFGSRPQLGVRQRVSIYGWIAFDRARGFSWLHRTERPTCGRVERAGRRLREVSTACDAERFPWKYLSVSPPQR